MRKISAWRVFAIGAGIVVIIVVVGILLIDPIVKWQIQTRGTRAVGARVELAQADVSFFPLGVTLTDLQVANPDHPTTNAIQVERIKAALEVGPLFNKKVIIDEMAMERVRFNTPRSTSGAVPGLGPDKASEAAQTGQGCRGLKLPNLGVPDVATILENAQLASLSQVAAVQTQIDRQQAAWKSKMTSLPGPATFQGYRLRIDKFTSGGKTSLAGLLGAPAEIQALQKDLQRDLDLLKDAEKVLESELNGLKGQLGDVKGLAAKDIDALVKKHGLSMTDLKNVSQALLGDAFCGWVIQALDWYDRIKPLLKDQSDPRTPTPKKRPPSDASKPEDGTLPDFLIRKAVVSVELKSGTITGGLRNVTTDQDILGQPTAFYLSGEKLKGVDLIQINGVLDHVRPASTRDTVDMLIRGLALENFVIPTGTDLPLTINRALAKIQLRSSFSGGTIDAVLDTGLTDAVIEVAQTGTENPIGNIIAPVLQGLRQVNMKAMVNGTVKDFTVKIESGLDQALAPAVSKILQKYTVALREELSTGIYEQVMPAMTSAQKDLAGLGMIQSELASRLDLGKELTQIIKRPF